MAKYKIIRESIKPRSQILSLQNCDDQLKDTLEEISESADIVSVQQLDVVTHTSGANLGHLISVEYLITIKERKEDR